MKVDADDDIFSTKLSWNIISAAVFRQKQRKCTNNLIGFWMFLKSLSRQFTSANGTKAVPLGLGPRVSFLKKLKW